jgi:hypothetical protein
MDNGVEHALRGNHMSRERRVFLWGVVVLVVLDLGVVLPIYHWTHLPPAPVIFLIEILAITGWTVWYQRARKKAADK